MLPSSSFSRSCIAIAVLSLASCLASTCFHYYFNAKKQKPVRKEINEVIMFSYKTTEVRKSKFSKCMITKSMERLQYYMNTARYTLDICMHVITNLDMSNVIMKLKHKGVMIRIIIDADMAYASGSSIKKMEKMGIPVRWMKSTYMMHHKFCLIDATIDNDETVPFVITGSLNWTNQALNGNWEDVLVTSQTDIVSGYKSEFESLWEEFIPVVNF